MNSIFDNKEVLEIYLTNGVEVLENKAYFENDKEFYFKDLGDLIKDSMPNVFCWYCEKTESLVVELSPDEEFMRITHEDNKIIFLTGDGFKNHSPMFVMGLLITVLLFSGHIEMVKEDESSEEESEEELSSEDSEWI